MFYLYCKDKKTDDVINDVSEFLRIMIIALEKERMSKELSAFKRVLKFIKKYQLSMHKNICD